MKQLFWIIFLCVFVHYADKIAYNEQRIAYARCVNLLGASLCEKQVPDPPLARFINWLNEYSNRVVSENIQTTILPNSG